MPSVSGNKIKRKLTPLDYCTVSMLGLNNTFLPLLAFLCLGGLFEKTRSQPHIYKDLSLQVSLKTIKSQPFFNASSSISRDLPTDPGCIALNDACDEQEEKDNCCDGLICWQEKPGKWPKCMPAISRCLEVSPLTQFYSRYISRYTQIHKYPN